MQIEVAFVNQPNKNPKFGSIKGTDGVFYDISAGQLHKYRKGMTFDAPVKSREWQGKTYYSIPDSFDPTGAAPVAVMQANAGRLPDAAPRTQANGSGISETQRQTLIVAQCILKILADGQNASGKPVETQDMPTLIQCAVASAKDMVSKV